MLELAGIIILGIFAQWIAWKVKIPAILPLILIGLAVGPYVYTFTSEDGHTMDTTYMELSKRVSSPERACFILFP